MSDYGHTHVMADLADWGVQRVAYYRELDRLSKQADRLSGQVKALLVAVVLLAIAGAILSIGVMFA